MRLFLELGIPPNIRNEEGESLVEIAIKTDQPRLVQYLLESGSIEYITYILHCAVRSGHVEIVRLILSYGAIYTETALIIAVQSGHAVIVEMLLKHGVKIDTVSKGGKTALMIASEKGHEDVAMKSLEKMCESEAGKKAIHRADRSDFTALHYAALNGLTEIVKALMEQGADVNKINKYGDTPLSLALRGGGEESEVVQLLRGEMRESSEGDPNVETGANADRKRNREKIWGWIKNIFSSIGSILFYPFSIVWGYFNR